MFRIYQAVAKEIKEHPEARARFPNFSQAVKPILASGARGPLSGELHSAQYFHGWLVAVPSLRVVHISSQFCARDGLANISVQNPDLNVPDYAVQSLAQERLRLTDRPGHEVALDMLRSHAPREITYIALGPLTNLAQMMRTDARCVRERVGRIVIMGGAFDVPGNTSPVAECMYTYHYPIYRPLIIGSH